MTYFNLKQKLGLALLTLWATAPAAAATTYNVAPLAKATASSAMDAAHGAECVNDGRIRIAGQGSWASASRMAFWGEISFPWVQLSWQQPVTLTRVVLYDRPEPGSTCAGGELVFDDGERILVRQIPADGGPCEVVFPPRRTRTLRFEVTDGDGDHIGLSEIEAFGEPTDLVSHVDPYVETTRGRYFFFVTGSQPFGMISAAPLTRNKNQGGGGYNYNDRYVLGFPQVHGWMLAGLDLMPTTGPVEPTLGEEGWKSAFSHADEVVQPAYHRLFLQRYGIWVEQTASLRTSLYRLTFTQDTTATVLLNLGGHLSTATMVGAHVRQATDSSVEGYFDTTGRLWGGPDRVRIFFTATFSRPFDRLTTWGDRPEADHTGWLLCGPEHDTPRNAGMSYSDAPTAGVGACYRVRAGEQIAVKFTVSYTSLDNARQNMDVAAFDFDGLRHTSQQQWNEWLGRISVKGGRPADRVKLYTDLWHVLLGRHIVDDRSGDYPDYTQGGSRRGPWTDGARLTVRHLAGQHHIYNSDALWGSVWNLNTLWGMAYPEVMDGFAASFLQHSVHGGLIPRGPCAGGYSYIMCGCPATSLIVSAYQQGLTRHWQPQLALRQLVRNHGRGGMLSDGVGDEGLRFYERHGYVPGEAGFTIEWAFEDWALAQMARRMGQTAVARRFERRSHGWTAAFHPAHRLVLPRQADGTWRHQNLLSGEGYMEANAWQATFGLSHDIPRLAGLMGGGDSLCRMLNHAFEQSQADDFMSDYGNGYVNYGNQPGLSNAHVFAHAGQPWLTQKWVRRVRRQTYGGVTPDKGYGGHDEDQGQMAALSALMSIGLFSIDGCAAADPQYDITTPLFDEVTIRLDPQYYPGGQFRIRVHGQAPQNDYIQRATLNGQPYDSCHLPHRLLRQGGELQLWLGPEPNTSWGRGVYCVSP